MFKWLQSPSFRFWFSIVQLVLVSLLWSAAALGIVAQGEPPFVLHLSFFAIWQGAFIAAITTDVRRKQGD